MSSISVKSAVQKATSFHLLEVNMSEEKSIPNYSPYGSEDYIPVNLRPSEHNNRDSSDYLRDVENVVARKVESFEKIADPAVRDYLEYAYAAVRADNQFFCDVLNEYSRLRAALGREHVALVERVQRVESMDRCQFTGADYAQMEAGRAREEAREVALKLDGLADALGIKPEELLARGKAVKEAREKKEKRLHNNPA